MDKIIECARKVLKHTDTYLQRHLACFIKDCIYEGNDTDFKDLLMVFSKIADDGFDVSGFGLYEIPHPSVYVFYNKYKKQMFDICLRDFCNTGERVCVAYTEYTDIGFVNIAVKTIQEAIDRYDFFEINQLRKTQSQSFFCNNI